MSAHDQFDSLMKQLEQELEEENPFDRLLEQEEELETKSFSCISGCSHRPSAGNPEVKWMQKALNRVSAFGIPENGVLSVQTKRALQKFQSEQGLRATGVLGPRTRAALVEESGILAPRKVAMGEGDTPLGEMEVPVGRCPVDNPHIIRGFRQFADDIQSLPPDQQGKLAAIATEIAGMLSTIPPNSPGLQVIVIGHADLDAARESREPGFLQSVSEKRAMSIGFELECKVGLGRFDFVPVGRGARQTVIPAPRNEAERACNRRVEIVLVRPAELLPRLDASQRTIADNRESSFREHYHIALQGTAGQFPPALAQQKAAEIAEKAVPFVEQRVQESLRCGAGPGYWNEVLQPYFRDALQGTASNSRTADEAINKAHEMAKRAPLVTRQSGRKLEWNTAILPQSMGPDCEGVRGKVPGPPNHLMCQPHGHILDIAAKTVIAHDLDEYKRLFRR